jgi:hypothetical protein
MLRLRPIVGARHMPLARSPSRAPARSLYQTRAVAAAAATKARPRMPSSRHQPTMQPGRNSRQGSPSPRRHELSGPLNTEKAILSRYPPVGVDAKMLKLPKEPLSLYVRKLTNSPPHFVSESGLFEGREYWRCVLPLRSLSAPLLMMLQGICAHGEWTERYCWRWGPCFKEGSRAAGCFMCYPSGSSARQSKFWHFKTSRMHTNASPSFTWYFRPAMLLPSLNPLSRTALR